MKDLPFWTKLPTRWIEAGGLQRFRWVRGEGANNLAALITLAVLSHHIDLESGVVQLTYDRLSIMTGLSRAKISAGLLILKERGLIEDGPSGRSSYRLANYDKLAGWAKFPAKGLYRDGVVAFADLQLRKPAELDAMKLYFLFAARRANETNMASISYDKIEEYTGLARNSIKKALSVLAVNGLVHIEHVPRPSTLGGFYSAYRLAHLNGYQHMGTSGRGMDPVKL